MPGDETTKKTAGAADAPPAEPEGSATPTADEIEHGEVGRAIREELGLPEPSAPKGAKEDQAKGDAPPKEEPSKEEPSKEEPPKEEPPAKEDETERPKGLTPEAQVAFDKRVAKEVAKRKDLEDALEEERGRIRELRQELATLKETRATSLEAGNGNLLAAETEADIDQREDYLWRWERWCERHPNGHEATTPEERSYTAEEIREIRLQVREERERMLPRAREAVRARKQYEPIVRAAYPELEDPRSEAGQELARLLRQAPGLRALPDYRLWVGDALAGRKAREALKQSEAQGSGRAAAAAAQPRKAPPAPVAGSSSSTSGSKAGTKLKSHMETFRKGGFSDEALEEGFRQEAAGD